MLLNSNRRETFRRYADRRARALLELYEVFFSQEKSTSRDNLVLSTIRTDFETNRAALVLALKKDTVSLLCTSGKWENVIQNKNNNLHGSSISRLLETQAEFEGALTLSRFRNSSLFEKNEWDDLWSKDLGQPSSAILSVPITCAKNSFYLWLILDETSREWSSHDRDLAEEEAAILARMIDKKAFTWQENL